MSKLLQWCIALVCVGLYGVLSTFSLNYIGILPVDKCDRVMGKVHEMQDIIKKQNKVVNNMKFELENVKSKKVDKIITKYFGGN